MRAVCRGPYNRSMPASSSAHRLPPAITRETAEPPRASISLLRQLSPSQFMRRHWQKEALLVRQAIPRFEGELDREDLFALAMRDDVESRMVQTRGGRWSLTK